MNSFWLRIKTPPTAKSWQRFIANCGECPRIRLWRLDLPVDEEMGFDTYEAGVVGPVRRFLTENKLREKIKCLVTFYGVPFRIKDKRNTPDENRELAMMREVEGTRTSNCGKWCRSRKRRRRGSIRRSRRARGILFRRCSRGRRRRSPPCRPSSRR